jgi:translation initiation factor 1
MEDLFKGIQIEEEDIPKNEQSIRVHLEKKGRGGKIVTLIKGLEENEETLKAYTKSLKKSCGVGGSLQEDDEILLQGNVRDQVIKFLKKEGYSDVKKSGG